MAVNLYPASCVSLIVRIAIDNLPSSGLSMFLTGYASAAGWDEMFSCRDKRLDMRCTLQKAVSFVSPCVLLPNARLRQRKAPHFFFFLPPEMTTRSLRIEVYYACEVRPIHISATMCSQQTNQVTVVLALSLEKNANKNLNVKLQRNSNSEINYLQYQWGNNTSSEILILCPFSGLQKYNVCICRTLPPSQLQGKTAWTRGVL